MMNSVSKGTLLSFLILGVFVSDTPGAITLECLPIGGTGVTGGQVVEFECIVTTDADQTFLAAQQDFDCDLPGEPGSTGSIVGGIGFPFVDVAHVDPPFLFDPMFTGVDVPGVGIVFSVSCMAAEVAPGPQPGGPLALLPAGASAYLSTMVYDVSDCATGEFLFDFEGYSDPPHKFDSTKFIERIDDGSVVLIPFSFTPFTLTVVTGTCCDGSTCLEDGMNRLCCAQTHPGAFFHAERSCADPYPCLCRGDVFPGGGNGLIDIDDLLCGLQGFADILSCPDADLIPCGGNGIIDIDDIVALLNAFAGVCAPCP